eukprot:1346080-Pyramimonas_sp.AAC.1
MSASYCFRNGLINLRRLPTSFWHRSSLGQRARRNSRSSVQRRSGLAGARRAATWRLGVLAAVSAMIWLSVPLPCLPCSPFSSFSSSAPHSKSSSPSSSTKDCNGRNREPAHSNLAELRALFVEDCLRNWQGTIEAGCSCRGVNGFPLMQGCTLPIFALAPSPHGNRKMN